ncbi:ATP-binding protein [Curvibacter sp. RS43]|uniref:sensor histidine kinase n=1 Tax=Curvibacter microcysteis TaxID=3026419 RepID=UPI00235F556B|nr:ATP-binding protein [Curvibacter sp. RS43]MDD0811223.1 ATP-binding protein [Curvibacter sp. RS43]
MAVLTLGVAGAWRLASDPPLREAVVRNATGDVVGSGSLRLRPPPPPHEAGGLPLGPPPHAGPEGGPPPHEGEPHLGRTGPEFVVKMDSGEVLNIHLPRPPRNIVGKPFGFFWTLGLCAIAVALATYPIIRKLTRRLEELQRSVERWGDGDLSVRVPVKGHDEVAYLAGRFNHAAERIQTLMQSHKALLANASHELRSPLARIRMGVELMGTQAAPGFREEIKRNIAELDQLIDEILLASRLDASEADLGTLESVDLVGLSAEECARVGAELEADDGSSELAVTGVAKLLRRAVRNLLENARRYGQGDISVKLSRQGPLILLAVCDRGPGVPPALRERIFEPFYRLPGASEREGGVGLGLALVKSIAERHGGSVHCEEHEGGGACFVLTLPHTP